MIPHLPLYKILKFLQIGDYENTFAWCFSYVLIHAWDYHYYSAATYYITFFLNYGD